MKVGVDLGIFFIVFVVLDEYDVLFFGVFEFVDVVCDGFVVNYCEFVEVVIWLKDCVEKCLGIILIYVFGVILLGIVGNNKKVVVNVIESVGMEVLYIIDELIVVVVVLGL